MQPEIVPLPEKASHLQFVPEMDFNSLVEEEASEKSVADYVNNFFSNISFGDDPFQKSSFPDLDLVFLEQPSNLILNPAPSKTIFGNPKDFPPVQFFYEEQEAPVNYSLK
ncbi:hypothetical protein JTE90_000367 [Oedothorax gibbosus]|uniref:Uncharacterized protein n=1 Tax=Oedothorax gibbosus TaxID=931172 RepID=A0AAV6TRI6_9ARAC|nr:hypothetical protein JTE90_000367 [Oedothorax gibbosus]